MSEIEKIIFLKNNLAKIWWFENIIVILHSQSGMKQKLSS